MTIRSYLEKFAQETPQATALRYFEAKDWHARSWADFLAGVRAVAEAYGPRFALCPRAENVALMLPNGPEWMEAYLACSGAGVGVVPLDPKLHSAEVEYILKDSGAVVVTTDKAHLDLMRLIAPNLPDLRAVVLVDAGEIGPDALGDVPLFDYVALKSDPETVRRAAGHEAWYGTHVAQEEDVASIIYTSGTTGKPKGAMLTHANFIADIEGALRAFDDMTVDGNDTLLVVLPLFHAFSFCTNFVLGLFRGCQMAFVRSLYTIGEDIRVLQPTIVMSVPLLAEKMFDRIDAKIKASKKARFLMAVGLGGLVRHNVRKGLGGRLRFMIVGGAPCPKHVLEGCRRLALPVLEGYGLTECSPVVSIAGPKVAKIGTIGLKLANIEIRLADQNEQGVGELDAGDVWLRAGERLSLALGPGPGRNHGCDLSSCRFALERIDYEPLDVVSVDFDADGTLYAGDGRVGWLTNTFWNAWTPRAGATEARTRGLRRSDGTTRTAVCLTLARTEGLAVSAAGEPSHALFADGVASSGAADAVAFTLTGLTPGASYGLTLYSRCTDGTAPGVFTVGGEAKAATGTWFFRTGGEYAQFAVTADAEGTVTGAFAGAAEGEAALWCGLQVTGADFPAYVPNGTVLFIR